MKLKKFIPNSLYARFLLIIAVPVLIVQLVSLYVFFYNHIDNISKHMARNVVEEMEFIRNLVDEEEKQMFLREFTNNVSLNYRIIDKNKEFESNDNENNLSYIKPIIDPYNQFKLELQKHKLTPFNIKQNPNNNKSIIVNVAHNDKIISYEVVEKRIYSSTVYVFILWMALTAIITLYISLIFLRNQVKSIKILSKAAEKLGRGLNNEEIKIFGPKEVRSLAISFKKMQERLMRQISQRTDMLSGVSHDLRTPMTRMKLQLEMMGQDQDIIDLKNDISDMEKLVDEYLSFAKNDDKEKSHPVEVQKFIQEKVIKYYSKMDKKINALIKIEPKLKINLKKLALKRALINLIDNAFNHANKVDLVISESNSNLIIIIDDDGPGIAANERQKVLAPFYRIDNSRNLDKKINSGGSGLGLAIATDAITSQGGHIRLSESTMGGLRVTIFLPK